MRDEWRGLADEALERLPIERWLYRGLLLAVILLCAIIASYLGLRGMAGVVEQVTVAVLVGLALAAAAVAFTMRQQDLKIHRELRPPSSDQPKTRLTSRPPGGVDAVRFR